MSTSRKNHTHVNDLFIFYFQINKQPKMKIEFELKIHHKWEFILLAFDMLKY